MDGPNIVRVRGVARKISGVPFAADTHLMPGEREDFGNVRARVHVTGAVRGGTMWLTGLLRAAGLDVKHEGIGKDGMVSGFFWIDHPYYPAGDHPDGGPSKYDPEATLHVIRHPLESAESIGWLRDNRNIAKDKLVPWYEELGISPKLNPIEWGLRVWLLSHTKILEDVHPAMSWRLDKTEEYWPRIATILGLPKEMPDAEAVQNRNKRKDGEVSTGETVSDNAPASLVTEAMVLWETIL